MDKENIQTRRQKNLPKCMTVVVTGASSGIGLAQCEAFLSKGHRVIGLDKNPTPLIAYQDQFQFFEVDIVDSQAVRQVITKLPSDFLQVDVLCNTAGQLDNYETLIEMSEEKFQYYLNVNVQGHFNVIRCWIDTLLSRPASRIINMASVASCTTGGGGIAYTTAKHALLGMTRQLAYECQNTPIRVNAIAPGAIDTAMNAADFIGTGEMARKVSEQVPTRRWAQPEEVAALTLFLASDAADYIHGAILPIDGGWLIR